jgi:hypothetical protein
MTPEQERERLRYLQLKAKAAGAGQPLEAESDTIQEMHPAIDFKDRFIVKNLATGGPEQQIAYLAKKYPDMEFVADDKGNIKTRTMNEEKFRVIDPDTGFFSSPTEMLRDLSDVGSDIVGGIGTTLGTAAGGLAGIGTGPGALLTAAGGGAAASSGIEALKQGLGSAVGLEDNIDPAQIGVAGLAGAASPLLFGTGATAANVAGKGLAARIADVSRRTVGKEGFKGVAGEGLEAAYKAQSGLPGMAFRKITKDFAPGVGKFLSGVDDLAIKDAAKNLDKIDQFDANPEALWEVAESKVDDLLKKVNSEEKKVWGDLSKRIAEKSKGEIDLKQAIQPYWENIQNLQKQAKENPAGFVKNELDEALSEFQRIWGKPKVKITPQGTFKLDESFYKKSPSMLQKIKSEIAAVAQYDKRFVGGMPTKPPPSDNMIRVADKAYQGLNKSIDDIVPEASALRKRVGEIIEDKKYIYKNLRDTDKFITKAQQASASKVKGKGMKTTLESFDKKYGSSLEDARSIVNAVTTFSKDAPLTRQGAGAVIGGGLGYALVNQSGGTDAFGGMPGMALGALVGRQATSPAMLRKVLELSAKSNARGMGTGAAAKRIQDITAQRILSERQNEKKRKEKK